MKSMFKAIPAIILLFLTGCHIRTYTVEKPRTDLDIEGNRGYIMGAPKEEERKTSFGSTRKYTVVEIELGKRHHNVETQEQGQDTSLAGDNSEQEQGYASNSIEEEPDIQAGNETEYPKYKVRKNDTLQKISRRFYGTTKKWPKIYKANKDVLKSPDRVYPGQILRIPR